MTIKKQTKKEDTWLDEAGKKVPYKMLKASEKKNEALIFQVAAEALKVNKALAKLKAFIKAKVTEIEKNFHADYAGKKTAFKGNYTFFNFDYSIKLVVKVSQPISFDDMGIKRAKSVLDDFLKDEISSKNAAVKDMVMDAFETSRGNLDIKKILSLQRYADRVNDKRYTNAMQLIKDAIRNPFTCTYYQVWIRNAEGKYEAVKLGLSDL